jgi:Xaa-Pro aminopeptidase
MDRIEKLHSLVEEEELAGCLIAKPENIYYFTGVYPIESSFLIVPRGGEAELVVAPSSYREAREESRVGVVKGKLDMRSFLKKFLLNLGCIPRSRGVLIRDYLTRALMPPLGIEGEFLSIEVARKLGIRKYRDISPLIMRMRMVKDRKELRAIKHASEIADEAMQRVKARIKPGMREREISGLFDREAKKLGANETKARVRSGRDTAKPFAKLMKGVIAEGPLLIDYGATYENYWSDITRTFHVGKPAEEFEDAYRAVVEAKKAGLKHARAGVAIARVDRAVKEVLRDYGYEGCTVYTSGHGVGLEVHEPPIVSSMIAKPEAPRLYSDGDVQRMYRLMLAYLRKGDRPAFHENTVIALEPGIYLRDFGVRIEDMVLIKKRPRLLSRFPDALEEIIIC